MNELTKGTLLLSRPYLEDENFERSVILLCDHSDEGSFGLVLNDISEFSLGEVLEKNEEIENTLFFGGPVEHNTLHYIHNVPEIDKSIPVYDDLFWSGNFDEILVRVKTGLIKEEDIRFFVGYSGWDSGQLQEEIKKDSWFVTNLKPKGLLKMEIKSMWQQILKDMGGKYRQYANYPIDPSLN